jgi:hypothetical protein
MYVKKKKNKKNLNSKIFYNWNFINSICIIIKFFYNFKNIIEARKCKKF